MPRREWPLNVPCTELGCDYVAHYSYDSRRELLSAWERKRADHYKCLRHSKGDGVLSSNNLRTEWLSAPSSASVAGSPKKFFGHSGIIVGDGYYVSADDFPEGAKVRIICEVILP